MGVGSWPIGLPGMEWYHFVAGVFDADGVPADLVYTDPALFSVELSKVYGFEPTRYLRDTSAVSCDEIDVPWDDQLARVRNPLLYIGAAGGFGPNGEYQTQLVGSRDVTTEIVRERPEDEAAYDVGHADIFQAPASRGLFWRPILAWLESH
jgi:hypothetical protein